LNRLGSVSSRWFLRTDAAALGRRGWVRNRGGGAVELELIDACDRIEQLVEWLREGPLASEVRDVTLHWLPVPPGGGPDRVKIRVTA
jgi:acylphosphatase